MKLTRRTVVRGVVESTYGTDPGSSYTGLLVREGAEIQVEGEQILRDTLRDTLSPRGHVIGRRGFNLSMPLELRGAGETGGTLNVPELDFVYKCCAMQREAGAVLTLTSVTGTFEIGETVTNDTATETVGTVADISGSTLFIRDLQNMPSTSDSISGDTSSASGTVSATDDAYVYRPVSDPDSMDSATVHFYKDGILHSLTGARGTMAMNINVGEIPSINAQITGLYTTPSDSANPSVSYLDVTPSPAFGGDVVLGSVDLSDIAVNAMSFDLANDVTPRDDLQATSGRKAFEITGRSPVGGIDPDVSALSDHNPWTLWENATESKIALGIGSTAGERVRVVVPYALYSEVPYTDRNGVAAYNISYRATGSDTGDDEIMVIYY